MKRWALVAAVVAVTGVAVVAIRDEDPSEAFRLRSSQPIPGALGYALEPPPAGSRPELTPEEAQALYPAGGGDVTVGFATVRDTLAGDAIGPGWLLVARGVCLRDSKGELVSDARGTDPVDLECTDATMWMLLLDPVSGDPLVALTGYDPEGTFRLDVRAEP
ncbi:MAG TPA: hypothetical protein VF108_03340 [Actinomycetota bacterium]